MENKWRDRSLEEPRKDLSGSRQAVFGFDYKRPIGEEVFDDFNNFSRG